MSAPETAIAPSVDNETMTASHGSSPASMEVTARRKKLVRVRKDRVSVGGAIDSAAPVVSVTFRKASKSAGMIYILLLTLRLCLAVAPGILESAEATDGVPALAEMLLPGMPKGNSEQMPEGMRQDISADQNIDTRANLTRSIVGAFLTSGVPYMAVNLACSKFSVIGDSLCSPSNIGYVAVYAPRLWMFALSLLGDALFVRVFAVYESEHAASALLTYASSWMTLLMMTRNSNFVLEALCILALLASCFGWTYMTPRPLFVMSGFVLALLPFLRPPMAVFVATPVIYLFSLWGKPRVDPIIYARGLLEFLAVFGVWTTIWITVDSVFYGFFKVQFGELEMHGFNMFVDHAVTAILRSAAEAGGAFTYKGYLVYVPVNACRAVLTRSFWTEILRNTSPGQMFLHLPVVLGPLFILLIRESIDGLKSQVKELMTEMKSASSDKKGKKKKGRKTSISKESEEELLVYFDTIQTTFLLGLLLEYLQGGDRLGVLSLIFLNGPGIICLARHVFGPYASVNARVSHLIYSFIMVIFYGFMNQSGVNRMLLAVGAGEVSSIPNNADIVLYRSKLCHPYLALGGNLKNVRVYDGGNDRISLLTTLRSIKSENGYDEERIRVCSAGTISMKGGEFELLDKLAYGHLSMEDMPNNIDAAFTQARLHVYKFSGDENEAIMRDHEEAADEEEREREQKLRRDEL